MAAFNNRIKRIVGMALCAILCWALVVAPGLYFVSSAFTKDSGVGTDINGMQAFLPSDPVLGTESLPPQESDLPDVDDPDGSDVVPSVSDSAPAVIQGFIDPGDCLGKLNNLELPVAVIPPVEEPPVEEPPVEEPPVEEPPVEEPPVEEPPVEEPPVEEPPVEEPPTEEPEFVPPFAPDTSVDPDGDVGYYGDYALLAQPDGSSFIYYDQTWPAYKNYPYGSDTVGGHGCGPVSMAMVVSNLTDYVVNPTTLSDWAVEKGYFVSGRGTSHSIFATVASMYNIPCTTISSSDKDAVVSALKAGKLLITIVDKCEISPGRHFLLIRGITDDGELLLADSGEYENCKEPWAYDRVIKQIANGKFWVFG